MAESVKTLTWRYMMRLKPFDDDTMSDRKFVEELDAIRKARSGLQLRVGSLGEDAEQITPRMREARHGPSVGATTS